MKLALVQICSVLDPQKNLAKIDYFIKEAKKSSELDAVFLPEVFYSMSDGSKPTPYLVETNSEHYKNIKNLAKENEVALIGGSAATKIGNRVINRTYNFDSLGNELAHYDKMHLFSVDLSKDKSKTVIDEATVYTSGNSPQMISLGSWQIGLGICFDVRFPELFRHYYQQGANLMTVASAFTVPTGKAHWKTLLRARAIENQSYVVAAAQWGQHNEKISTYGHSMIVDPWGQVVADVGDGEGYVVAELETAKVEEARGRMKVHPRFEISF